MCFLGVAIEEFAEMLTLLESDWSLKSDCGVELLRIASPVGPGVKALIA